MPTSVAARVNTFLLVVIALMAAAIIAMLASRASAGPLDPPSPPAATDGVLLPGTPISTLPFTISESGSYYVTHNLVGTGGQDGIIVDADNVTIDLRGFTLDGASAGQYGINVPSARAGVTVRDGTVTGWASGLQLANAVYSRVERVASLQNTGIGIAIGADSVIADCEAHGNQDGIVITSATVRDCSVTGNSRYGIDLIDNAFAVGNHVRNNGVGVRVTGAYATVTENELTDNSTDDLLAEATADGVVARDNTFTRVCANSYQYLGPNPSVSGSMFHHPSC
jgi:hypothetical protein